jgi:steroid delta-isomerase-like uncharacterized protein
LAQGIGKLTLGFHMHSTLEANKQLIREHYEELVNRNNLTAAERHLSPNFVDHNAPPGTPPGAEAARRAMQHLHAALPDVHVTLHELTAEEDRVAVRATWQGTHLGRLFGIAPTGRRVTIHGIVLWRIENGRIAERWATVDLSDLRLSPPPGTLRGVSETALYAGDLSAADKFYTEVLGLKKILAVPGRQLVFRCGDAVLLIFDPERTRREQVIINGGVIPFHGAAGAGHAAFAVDDDALPGWRERFRMAGVAIESEVSWPNGAHSVYFRDPAGNSLELVTSTIWALE